MGSSHSKLVGSAPETSCILSATFHIIAEQYKSILINSVTRMTMQAVCSSENLVRSYKSERRHNP